MQETIEKYLHKEISKIVDVLFLDINENNINVNKSKEELNLSELNMYLEIYKNLENELVEIKTNAINKFKIIPNEKFNYDFGVIVQNIVTQKFTNNI